MSSPISPALPAAGPDPEAAERRLQLLLAVPGAEAALRRLPPDRLPALVRLLSLSAFLTGFLCRHPEELAQCGQAPGSALPACAGPADPGAALRHYKYRELLKTCFLDVAGERPCETVLADFSRLAEGILGRALEQVCGLPPAAWEEQGVPCVLALGKLGAGELNLSSDVDLVYATADCELPTGPAQERLRRAADWCARLAHLVQERDAQGFLYRIDLRLRPWGTQGPPLMTVDAMESYYGTNARPWERLAWIRARRVSGAAAPGQELLRRLAPFLYLRSLGQDDIEGLVEVKRELTRQRTRPGSWNVKTGPGGIREMEFFVHILQLLHGARRAQLRTTSTLAAISGLVPAGLLRHGEARDLRNAYLFLRRLENFLQLAEEQQTHELPDDPRRRTVLARALFPGAAPREACEQFEDRLQWSRSLAADCFSRVLPETGGRPP